MRKPLDARREGKPHSEPDHPDYIPSVFLYTAASTTPRTTAKKIDRFNRRLKRVAIQMSQHFVDSASGSTQRLIKEVMTEQSQEAKHTDREPEEKLEIKALFQTKRIPANVLYGESTHALQLQDHLHIKKEEEELWENMEEKQETDITAVTVKSEDEEEESQCSLLHWRQSENIKGEPAAQLNS
ncbi:uncharacterized protein LOC114474824 isoform X2 [Gouania willdenowi]|uniref:uncharacterized protein LOC114474824 isoform X2 n=1 Tax=Gouania willdenowi TaxID=441366 RepID=UPI001056BFC3|nr:uncharacterized protein LOC114474824 isoform X2 [Gouania willdenowi]